MFDTDKSSQQINREILIRELRENPPQNWNFERRENCALGLAERMGLIKSTDYRLEVAAAFGLLPDAVWKVFVRGCDVGPGEVADRLEHAELCL